MQKLSFFIFKCIAFYLLLIGNPALSATVIQSIEPLNLKAEAEYSLGEPTKPAVLILHGFLTTNEFLTIKSISEGLQEEGYSTLAPTLTLNISQRRNLIKCSSLHTHTLERDAIEVEHWVNWLQEKGHQEIILIGHSSGSLVILEYLSTKPNQNISAAIFTSLFYLNGPEFGVLDSEIQSARIDLQNQVNRPTKYNFLFCNHNYYATPKSFLSYLKIDRNYTLDSLNNIKIPSYTIMGSADQRYHSVGTEWLSELEQTKTKLKIIEGANHFFSSEYEFDLQDKLTQILNQH